MTQPGYGFSGISHFSNTDMPSVISQLLMQPLFSGLLLPEVPALGTVQTVSVAFQPRRDNGLVLMVTDGDGSSPMLAVGMFNGEVNMASICTNAAFNTVSSPFPASPVQLQW